MNKLYGLIVKMIYSVTWPFTGLILHNSNRVRVYVMAEDKLLLQKTSYSSQNWSLPGGGISKKESPVIAAKRELAEETGLELDQAQFKELGQARVPLNGRSWPIMNITYYEVKLPKLPKVSAPRPLEIIAIDWFDSSKLPENISQNVREAQKLLGEKQ
jgi:8-oxo-dGTP pyrophosphatase MutT (NUDIX family)